MELPQRPGSRLDSYVDRYAARTRGMTASEIRALFAVASRPEVVSLAGGMPNLAALPMDSIATVAEELVRESGTVAMQYGGAQGDEKLREQICDIMRLEGIEGHPDDVIATVGSQQALDLVTRIFIDPGDVILAEGPSYVGALGVFASYQAQVVHVEMDDQGLVPETLREAIAAVQASRPPSKFLYTIPNFHNPAGVTLAVRGVRRSWRSAREPACWWSRTTRTGCSASTARPIRRCGRYDPDNVVYLGSFSKTFAPGLRVGWVLAPHAVREKLVLAAESATLCPPAFTQMMVSRYLSHADWRGQIKSFRETYRERRDATLTALDQHAAGGLHVDQARRWLLRVGSPSRGLDTKAMLPRAVTARVAYVSGDRVLLGRVRRVPLRLSYCYPTPERIREGVRRFADVLREEMELRAAFGHDASRALESRDGVDTPGPDLA